MEPQIKFAKDLTRINRRSFNVFTGGVFRYVVANPGVWTAYTDDLSKIRVEIGSHLLVIKDDEIIVDGREVEALCWKARRGRRCLDASGIKIRIGSIILAHYSFIDQLPVALCSRRRMLYYINRVEKEPNIAEFAVKVLATKNTLNDENLIGAVLKEIGKIRLATLA
jgi:hypothetical protein